MARRKTSGVAPTAAKSKNVLLFDHPEAEAVLGVALELLTNESDRGALIVGTDLVDSALGDLFKAIFPNSLTSAEQKELLGYPGALSSLAGKAKIAFSTRLIDRTLFDAVTALRKLRNEVAHSAAAFRLADHRERLRKIASLGEDVPSAVNRFACEALVSNAIHRMREVKVVIEDKELVPIATDQSAIEWLKANTQVLRVLGEHQHRYELAISIGIICALLIHYRDEIAAKFGPGTLITS